MLAQKTEVYLESLHERRNPLIEEMISFAAENHVPIIENISMEVLLNVLKIKQAKKILEIGTAIGYSSIRMAMALPDSIIVTIDNDYERIQQAKMYVSRAQLDDQIHIYCGDARSSAEILKTFGPYDALFIDAAKSQYKQYFNEFSQMVCPGGIVISDNVLFRGLIADHEKPLHRYKTIVQKLRDYNDYLAHHPNYDTTFYPVGDGMAVSIKK